METLTQSITGNWKIGKRADGSRINLTDQPRVGAMVLAGGVERKIVEILELGGLRSFVLDGDAK